MGHPGVAAVGVVLDHQQPAARPQVSKDSFQDRQRPALEVQRVGHQDPVQRRQREWLREVGLVVGHARRRKALGEALPLPPQGGVVAVDGVDLGGGAQQIGQGQGEGALPGAEVGPEAGPDPVPDQADEIFGCQAR